MDNIEEPKTVNVSFKAGFPTLHVKPIAVTLKLPDPPKPPDPPSKLDRIEKWAKIIYYGVKTILEIGQGLLRNVLIKGRAHAGVHPSQERGLALPERQR